MDLVRSFLRGVVALHVVHHAHEGEVHGAALIEELSRHGHVLSPGTIYPMLHRLEGQGLLVARDIVARGHPRRLYRTTQLGDEALAECRAALEELADEILDC